MRTRRTENNPHGLVLFDSHCHLTDNQFGPDLRDVVKRAFASGVRGMMVPGQNVPDSREAVALCKRFDGLYCAVGVHPHEADHFRSVDISALKDLCIEPGIKAIGEIGLDFFRTISSRPNQEMAFGVQVELARSMDLPMIIHVRDAVACARQVLEEREYYAGVMHCFSADARFAEWAVEKGFYISFAGNLTYRESRLADIVRLVPRERLMVETDAPNLAPGPMQGKRNVPEYIHHTVVALAAIVGLTPKEAGQLTFENARRCFRITD